MDLTAILGAHSETVHRMIELYRDSGRPILDFLHVIFDNIFDVILMVAILVSALYLVMSLFLLFKKKKKNYKFNKKKAPFVTVQIPTLNELVAIRCAKKCLNFDYPKNKYEILIGDDSNKSFVSKKLDEFARKHKQIKIVKRTNNVGYKAGNLNNMLKYSKGSIIVLFDSDFVPSRNFLRRVVTPFTNKNVSAVQARWKFINTNQNLVSILGSTIVTIFHHIMLPFISKRNLSFLCGSAEAVRKDVLVKLGGWEKGCLTEDIEFSLRLLKNGYKIEYLGDLECDSEVPYKAKDLYKQQMRWAYGVISSFKKHGKDIITSKKLNTIDKFYIYLEPSGYLFSVLLLFLFVTGFLSFITHAPEPINFAKFFSELAKNVSFTSGFLIAGIIALTKSNNLKGIFPMIISSISYGLVVTYYVNIGILKVLTKRPMKWYMLHKSGNKLV